MHDRDQLLSTLDKIGPVDLLYYEKFGDVPARTLDPDAIADTAWELYGKRDRAEEIFSVFG